VHPKVISERLGHSTVAMTLDIYSHAIPALQHDATIIADLISGTTAVASA
jgi:integrase